MTNAGSVALSAAPASVLRVAIIDDNDFDRLEAKAALLRGSTLRFAFREYPTGEQALAACAADPPDCLLLDLVLGDMDAFEVLERLERDADGLIAIPVVVMTGSLAPGASRRLLRAGAMDFLGKEWLTPDSLSHAVENALERHAMLREQAEHSRRLRASEQQFATLADVIPQLVWSSSADGGGTWVNQRWLEYTGQTPEQAAADGWHGFVHPDDAERTQAAWRVALRDGSPLEIEHRLRKFDGSHRAFLARALPFRDVRGGVVRWFGTATDVDASRRLQHELRRSSERLELAHSAAGIGTWEWNVETDGMHWSKELYDLLGIDRDDPDIRSHWHACVHPEDVAGVDGQTRKALSGETVETEYRYTHPTRGDRWFVSKARLVDTPGSDRLVYGASFDITERKRMEGDLKEASRRKDDFLAMLAHELRNPLAPLRNGVAVLRQLVPDAGTGQQVLAMLDRQTTQLTRLIDDLLDVSRVTRGRIDLRLEIVDLCAVMTRAIESVQPLLRERAHELSVGIPADPVQVQGDAARLVQVIGNLLANSAKYTNPGGSIELRLDVAVDEVTVVVRDNGGGIDATLLPYVFDMFVQNERTLDRAQGGLGLGLTIVNHVVGMHGGRVEARSDGIGRGAEFRVHLPRVSAPLIATETCAISARLTSPRRILIVDDNRDSADTLAALLRMEGHVVDVAYHADDGLQRAGTPGLETVLLDIGLPDMDGYEVARRLRTQPGTRTLELIALTGYAQESDRLRALNAGFDLHLSKPVDPRRIVELMAQGREQTAS